MLFLVTAEYTEPGPLLSPEQVVSMVENLLIPRLEMLAQWEQEGKCTGGVFAGERAESSLLEANSAEEVGQLLSSLPFWALLKWQVRPLQSTSSAADRERRVVNQLKGAPGN
jgi:muconolactone delta-isomerase